jgi:hypothetical protein
VSERDISLVQAIEERIKVKLTELPDVKVRVNLVWSVPFGLWSALHCILTIFHSLDRRRKCCPASTTWTSPGAQVSVSFIVALLLCLSAYPSLFVAACFFFPPASLELVETDFDERKKQRREKQALMDDSDEDDEDADAAQQGKKAAVKKSDKRKADPVADGRKRGQQGAQDAAVKEAKSNKAKKVNAGAQAWVAVP